MAFISQLVRRDTSQKREKNGLWQLSVPREQVTFTGVDIVAVHGLGGDAFGTWTDENGKLWLRDFLPERLQSARVYTYGYDSVVAFSKSSGEVDDFARDLIQRVKGTRGSDPLHKRPLYFICHSLGGLVVKQVLSICRKERETVPASRRILDCVSGVIFMGTPHAGADIAFWASLAGRLFSFASLGTRTNKQLLMLLQKDSAFLGALSIRFVVENPHLHILSFYELDKFPFLNCRIVEKDSARVGLLHETLLPIQADHRAMCRFSDSASQKYRVVEEAILGLISAATAKEEHETDIDVSRRKALNEWLNPVPTVDNFDRIKAERLEGSCEWIWKHPQFRLWLSQPGWRVCHLEGLPGCGKSTVVTRLIEDLGRQHPVAFFFCIVGLDQQDWSDIIRTWTWQLLDQSPHLVGGVFDIYTSTLGTTTPLATYFKALLWLVKNLTLPYLFLDGLDENSKLEKQWFQGLVFTTRRPESWIRTSTHGDQSVRLVIPDGSNEDDISRFLSDGLAEVGWDAATTSLVHKKICRGSKGMFLWAKLMLHHVTNQVSLADLERSLAELPDGLDSLYSRILEKLTSLPESRARPAFRALQWVFSATRPLSLSELEIALAIEPGSARLDDRSRMMNFRRFLDDNCSPLLQIHEPSKTVAFVHASVQQYLQQLASQENPVPTLLGRLSFIEGKRGPYLSAVCLTYLASDDILFVRVSSANEDYARNLVDHVSKYPFLRYAALNVWEHFPRGFVDNTGSHNGLDESLRIFFARGCNLVKWLQLFQLLGGTETHRSGIDYLLQPDSAGTDRLQRYPIFRNLGATESKLFVRWDRWISEDFFNGHKCSPITIAAFFDLVDVVKQQLTAGAPVDDDSVLDLTPFLYAVHGDALEVVKLLLQYGADPTKLSNPGYGALRYASRNCIAVLPTILMLKVPSGAADNDEGTTPLHAVCSSIGCHPSVFDGLLNQADANDLEHKDSLGRTPLHRAASLDAVSLAALMYHRQRRHLEDGVQKRRIVATSVQEVFTPTAPFSVKAWAEAWLGHLEGNPVDTKNSKPPSPSRAPNSHSDFQELGQRIKLYLLRRILERNSAVNPRDLTGQTPLHLATAVCFTNKASQKKSWQDLKGDVSTASENLRDTSVELLLAREADPHLRDNSAQQPLDIAVGRGDWSTAGQLSEAMLTTDSLSENETQRLLDIRALLDSDDDTAVTQLEASTWVESSLGRPIRSRRDLAEVMLMLRSCFSTTSSRLGRDAAVQTRLVQQILDSAEYWVVTIDSVDVGRALKAPELWFCVGPGPIRRIDFFVGRKNQVRLDCQHCWYESSLHGQYKISNHCPNCYSSNHCDHNDQCSKYWGDIEARNIGRSHLLRLRYSAGMGKALALGAEDQQPPNIRTSPQFWKQCMSLDSWTVWKQVWPMTTEEYKDNRKATRQDGCWQQDVSSSEVFTETSSWLRGLKKGDILTLEPAEGFSFQDIAIYSHYGVAIYSII